MVDGEMKERVGGRQRSLSFFPPCFLLPWDTADSKKSASPGEGPGGAETPLIFSPNWGPKGQKKFSLRPDSPLISGSRWPPPPPYLKVFQSKFLAPSQFLYLGQSILSAQLVNVHFVCATLITPVCLFFVEQERISRHLYLGLFVMFVLFLILWPNSTDLLSRRGLAERWDCWNCNLEVSTFNRNQSKL